MDEINLGTMISENVNSERNLRVTTKKIIYNEKKSISESSSISFLGINVPTQVILIMNNIFTIKDLLEYNVMELLFQFNRISLFTVAILKNKMNELGYHLKGEEIVDYSDYLDNKRQKALNCCDKIILDKKRLMETIKKGEEEIKCHGNNKNQLKAKLEEAYKLEQDLDFVIEALLNHVCEIRESDHTLT